MSPIFGHFGETVHGLLTLRAFRGQERFVAHNRALVNSSNRAYWGIQEVHILWAQLLGSRLCHWLAGPNFELDNCSIHV